LRKVKLKDICTIKSGGTPSRKKKEFFGGSIPWAKISDITSSNGVLKKTEEYITEAGLSDINNRLFKKGTLLFSMYGTLGETAVAGTDLSTNQAILGINPKNSNEIESEYLRYWFKYKQRELDSLSRGVALKNLSATIVKDFEIPLPSLSKQKAIVAKLDRAQRLIDIDKEMLAKYDELIQSVFLEMFGDPVTNPKGWEVKKLGDLTTKVGSGSTPRGGSKVYQDHGNIFIRSQNVLMNKVDLSDVAYISDEIHEGMRNTWVQENDVLLNITGASIGRVCVYNKSEAANVNQHVCILRPIQDKIKPYYLSHLISSKNYQDKILGQQTGGTRQAFNMTQIKNFDIPLPPLDFQTQFNGMLTKLKDEIQNLKVNSKKSEELFSSLVQGAFG